MFFLKEFDVSNLVLTYTDHVGLSAGISNPIRCLSRLIFVSFFRKPSTLFHSFMATLNLIVM